MKIIEEALDSESVNFDDFGKASNLLSTSKYLPIEIISDILVQLPVESIVKCMCVCKEWYNLIKNPNFISSHLDYSYLHKKMYDDYLLYIHNRTVSLVSYETFDVALEFKFQFEKFANPNGLFGFVGSVHGLLCLFYPDQFGQPIYLINPSIRKWRALRPHRYISAKSLVLLGFGYHQESDDYKIVRFIQWEKDVYKTSTKTDVEEYSLSTNSWKKIEVPEFPWRIRNDFSSALVNECLHWKLYNWDLKEHIILSFHVGEEQLKELEIPDYLGPQVDLELTVGVLKECLCLFAYVPSMHDEGSEHCYLWMMEEYGDAESWTLLFDIVVQERVRRCLCFTEYDQILMEDGDGNIFLYDVDNEDLDYLRIPKVWYQLQFATYMESLVLIEEKNEILEQDASLLELELALEIISHLIKEVSECRSSKSLVLSEEKSEILEQEQSSEELPDEEDNSDCSVKSDSKTS